MNLNSSLCLQVFLHFFGPMSKESIPNQANATANILLELLNECYAAVCIEVSVFQQAKKYSTSPAVRSHCNCTHGGHFAIRPRHVVDYRSLPTWCPSPAKIRSHLNASFICKDYGGLRFLAFFTIFFHSTLTNFAMPSSSLSMARRSGFCGVHPSFCRSRQTWLR